MNKNLNKFKLWKIYKNKWTFKKVRKILIKIFWNLEDYDEKKNEIFNLLNNFRKNPKELAKKLELLRTYLDTQTNILSEPNKIQIQMVEGDNVFKEAISFLKSIKPLPPLEWDQNLYSSAQEHVNDIGPKGLLLYQSSDGTEPEVRINKYCNYESLGENIDFVPNDAMGVIISLTLDDGEEQRPHRENLFKDGFNKVGIACGPHQTEFQMCVMDFAGDYNTPDGNNNNNKNMDIELKMNKEDMMNNSNFANNNNKMNFNTENPNNQSPLVKLSLENDELKNNLGNQNLMSNYLNMQQNVKSGGLPNGNQNDVDKVLLETINAMNNLKIINKKIEITTNVTFTYEDGSTRTVSQVQTHEYK